MILVKLINRLTKVTLTDMNVKRKEVFSILADLRKWRHTDITVINGAEERAVENKDGNTRLCEQ